MYHRWIINELHSILKYLEKVFLSLKPIITFKTYKLDNDRNEYRKYDDRNESKIYYTESTLKGGGFSSEPMCIL